MLHSDGAPYPDKGKCTGCGRCVAACAQHLLTLEVRGYRKTANKLTHSCCTCCRSCMESCPVGAIHT
ncbi:MAG: 4Fe-4S ferredoxin [Geobacter sp.]|nr:MAG: 4Fe-4S ferredoxin [Geobacter sp.]